MVNTVALSCIRWDKMLACFQSFLLERKYQVLRLGITEYIDFGFSIPQWSYFSPCYLSSLHLRTLGVLQWRHTKPQRRRWWFWVFWVSDVQENMSGYWENWLNVNDQCNNLNQNTPEKRSTTCLIKSLVVGLNVSNKFRQHPVDWTLGVSTFVDTWRWEVKEHTYHIEFICEYYSYNQVSQRTSRVGSSLLSSEMSNMGVYDSNLAL